MSNTAFRLGRLAAGVRELVSRVEKFNPNHDPSTGRFTSGSSGTGGGTGGSVGQGKISLGRPGSEHYKRRVSALQSAKKGMTTVEVGQTPAFKKATDDYKEKVQGMRSRARGQTWIETIPSSPADVTLNGLRKKGLVDRTDQTRNRSRVWKITDTGIRTLNQNLGR